VPTEFVKVPAEHALHVATPAAPVTVLNLPTAQPTQSETDEPGAAVDAMYVPGTHETHPVVVVAYLPVEHVVQEAALADDTSPAAHIPQPSFPVPLAYLPASQSAQEARPSELVNVPEEQATQRRSESEYCARC